MKKSYKALHRAWQSFNYYDVLYEDTINETLKVGNQITNRMFCKMLQKSYRALHLAWQSFNYYDVFYEDELNERLEMLPEQYKKYKACLDWLTHKCKDRINRLKELKLGKVFEHTITRIRFEQHKKYKECLDWLAHECKTRQNRINELKFGRDINQTI